jgi:hypothetical protein
LYKTTLAVLPPKGKAATPASLFNVYAGLVPVITAAVSATIWVVYSPTNVLQHQTIQFLLAIGFLFAFLVVTHFFKIYVTS